MPKEFDIINYFRQQNCAAGKYIETGPGDDMAVMNIGGEKLLITTDMLLEDVHFELGSATLAQIGYKAMACSLSDCAAMCSVPIAAVGSISLPKQYTMEQIALLHSGLKQASAAYNCPIIGGDMTSWDKPLTITITMLSLMTEGRKPIYRSGAKPGDKIMATGTLGGSILGRHLSFEPRVNEALWLYDHAQLHSMMDLSDGIGGDLRHICQESQVSAIVNYTKLPVSVAASSYAEPGMHALLDGEDFELLFTVSPEDCTKLLELWPPYSKLELTEIGEIVEKRPAELYLKRDGETKPFDATGFEH